MKVRVDPELCAGFGICTGISSELFEISDDGYAVVLVDAIPPELQDAAQRAESQCPARAITVSA